jgi:CheY-like chemotaxis protein
MSRAASPIAPEMLPTRVLVVDDNAPLLDSFARLLRANSFFVATASNGLHALRLVRQQTFDVILADVSMPVMSGLGMLRGIRERGQDVPVILMTGEPNEEGASEARRFGAFVYLAKPVPPREVVSTLRLACLSNAAQRGAN